MMRRCWPLYAALVGLAGMSPYLATAAQVEPSAVVPALLAQDLRLLRVGERLVTGAAAFCRPGGHSVGMTVQTLAQYGRDYRPAALAAGIGAQPSIAIIAPGSAAATAGLAVGDRILAIDGKPLDVPPPADPRASFAGTALAQDMIDKALADGVLEFAILRGDHRSTVTVVARPACAVRFDVRVGRSRNANSDGVYVQVSSDLVDQVANDDQLAAILAHELAHAVLRHPQRRKAREPGLSERATEIEADRLSVYLLKAAGFPPEAARAFWSGWGRRNDRGIFADRSHPGWRQRVATIDGEVDAIARQRLTGQPFVVPVELRPR